MVTFSLHFSQLWPAVIPGLQLNSAPAEAICKPPSDVPGSKWVALESEKPTCFINKIQEQFPTSHWILRDAFSSPASAVQTYRVNSEQSENTPHGIIKPGTLTLYLSATVLKEDTNTDCTSKVNVFSFGRLLWSSSFTPSSTREVHGYDPPSPTFWNN